MRKTKDDALQTRDQIVNTAFDCFFEKGIETTTLEEIAKGAGVTRGAIYWHFEDKKALYRAAVDMTLEQGDVAEFLAAIPRSVPLEQRLSRVFWMALNENRYVDFVFKAMAYTADRGGFEDVFQKLKSVKRRLLDAFTDEIGKYITDKGLPIQMANSIGLELFLLFEGMFLTKNIPVGIKLSKDEIDGYVLNVLRDLL